MKQYVIDTNALLAFVTDRNAAQQTVMNGIFEQVAAAQATVLCPQNVIAEFVYVMETVYHQPKPSIRAIIADFLAMYPEIDIVLELSNRVGFVKGKADLCVSIGDIGDDDWVKRPLATERVMLCAAPAYLNANGHPIKLEYLASHRLLATSSASSSTVMILTCRGQTHQIAGTIQLRSNDSQILMAAALQGVGIVHIRASFILIRNVSQHEF